MHLFLYIFDDFLSSLFLLVPGSCSFLMLLLSLPWLICNLMVVCWLHLLCSRFCDFLKRGCVWHVSTPYFALHSLQTMPLSCDLHHLYFCYCVRWKFRTLSIYACCSARKSTSASYLYMSTMLLFWIDIVFIFLVDIVFVLVLVVTWSAFKPLLWHCIVVLCCIFSILLVSSHCCYIF